MAKNITIKFDGMEIVEDEHLKVICRGHLQGLRINPRCSGCENDRMNKQCPDYIPQTILTYEVRDVRVT